MMSYLKNRIHVYLLLPMVLPTSPTVLFLSPWRAFYFINMHIYQQFNLLCRFFKTMYKLYSIVCIHLKHFPRIKNNDFQMHPLGSNTCIFDCYNIIDCKNLFFHHYKPYCTWRAGSDNPPNPFGCSYTGWAIKWTSEELVGEKKSKFN